jgi:Fe-S-cluster-containing hydrogenase component 2
MVQITEFCINCNTCAPECPKDAILSEDKNPNGENQFWVTSDCNECKGESDLPLCAEACPTLGGIVWSTPKKKGVKDGEIVIEK